MMKPEGFDAASREAALVCEKAYADCMKNTRITDKSKCQSEYTTCIGKITNPSVSTATPAASTPGFGSTSVASAGALRSDPGTYDARGNPTGTTGTVTVGNPSEGQTTTSYGQLASAAMSSADSLSPAFDSFLKQVQSRLGTTTNEPTPSQLDLAQGAGLLPQTTVTTTTGSVSVPSFGGTKDKPVYLTGEQVVALYAPAVQKIKAHQKPQTALPSLEPTVSEEDTTEYASIQTNRPGVASIRQMIRDDVAQIVREETDAARTGNPYEVKYEYA